MTPEREPQAPARGWTLRPYRDGDCEPIRALFEHAFGEPLKVERWNWQYRDHYTGQMVSIVAVGDQGDIVGHYAGRPVRMKIGSDQRLALLTVDAMVRSDFRKRGLFVHLGQHLHQVAAGRDVPLLYAFPQETSSHAFYTRLAWTRLYRRVPLYVRVLDVHQVLESRVSHPLLVSLASALGNGAFRLLAALAHCPAPDGYRVSEVPRFDERMDDLWRRASRVHPIIAVRDRVYLNWRFADNPAEKYQLLIAERGDELAGYAVLKVETRYGFRVGYVMDMLAPVGDTAAVGALVREGVERLRSDRTAMVGCLMLEHTWYARALARCGFIRVPEKLFPQVLTLGVYPATGQYPEGFLTDRKNWFVTFADHDYV